MMVPVLDVEQPTCRLKQRYTDGHQSLPYHIMSTDEYSINKRRTHARLYGTAVWIDPEIGLWSACSVLEHAVPCVYLGCDDILAAALEKRVERKQLAAEQFY